MSAKRRRRIEQGRKGQGKLETREFRAQARFQRVSPQKARLVLELIKGRSVEEALTTVAFTKKSVAPMVEKVLRSALQNANYLSQEQGLDVDVDNLYVKTAIANEGPRMKRIRPAPMGRAYRYQRRLSHIEISVAERNQGGLAHDGWRRAEVEAAPEEERRRRRCEEEGSGQEGGGEEGRTQEAAARRRSAGSQDAGDRAGKQGRFRGRLWDRKSILTDFGLA